MKKKKKLPFISSYYDAHPVVIESALILANSRYSDYLQEETLRFMRARDARWRAGN